MVIRTSATVCIKRKTKNMERHESKTWRGHLGTKENGRKKDGGGEPVCNGNTGYQQTPLRVVQKGGTCSRCCMEKVEKKNGLGQGRKKKAPKENYRERREWVAG